VILCSTISQLPFFTWHNILCAAVGSAVGAAFSVRRGVFFYACVLLLNTTICILHGNTVCVQRVFPVLVKCFSGEKVWSAASVRLSAFEVHGTVNFMHAAIFFTRTKCAAIFCACATTDGSSKFW
jgi:hypothetical protein